jgi:hypothetical protein
VDFCRSFLWEEGLEKGVLRWGVHLERSGFSYMNEFALEDLHSELRRKVMVKIKKQLSAQRDA